MKKGIYVCILALLLLTSCGGGSSYGSAYEEDREIGNPYSPDSGHYAGYEWAERTGRACSGNSQSFIEGCETYYEQTGY